MPIYEFYCEGCNTIFNFFSQYVNTEKRPICPRCQKGQLSRLISKVAFLKGAKEGDDLKIPDLDEGKLAKAMQLLENEAGRINEDDPRQAAELARKLFNMTGLNMGSGMEEALRRLEAGEDPDKIDEEMGDMLGEEDVFDISSKSRQRIKKRPPERDETLYYL
ncbi:MAG: zinc ribbon domain-containing protein [Nitrospirota bacterium]